MITNAAMKEGRFLRWHKARVLFAKVNAALDRGETVVFSTATRAIKVAAKNREAIRCGKDGLYLRRGRGWDFLGGCRVSVWG